MMTERQRKFREQYKSEISPLYNGLLHIAVMYGVGITGVWYCLTKIQDASWEWLMALPVFLAGNFVVSVQSTHLDRPQAAHLDCSCAPM